jgi:ArsR family transcriptional regulator, arsenate/arsenite/antimonite-responsive transcriptional repressor
MGLVFGYVNAYITLVRDLTLFYAALSDPTRMRLLSLMRDREICVCYLQAVLKTNQPKISRHLAYLKRAGLVEARRDGKWTHYRLKKQHNGLDKILSQTLVRLLREPQIASDLQRLERTGC